MQYRGKEWRWIPPLNTERNISVLSPAMEQGHKVEFRKNGYECLNTRFSPPTLLCADTASW